MEDEVVIIEVEPKIAGFDTFDCEPRTTIIPDEKSENNILDNSKKVVPAVPSVPSSTEETSQLKVVTDESGLRRIETNNLVNAERFKPKAGVSVPTTRAR